ncbi:23S rRNA pseudouridine2605 synthase [Alkalithermobacter thermoalcaliphilus JW-YL-7 = DSM 7308]|uniref:Pseudouridine synthase n=1 Tax=Alkalithermobacter thermoalcaliphilus JW-YL-7 = DSM 7308 TaxID=1121328 RepID=A0A150FQL6_CLOPD|nr:pseudouridine synthase Rsu [[Clostridium] paradoxum JW-YL-7 = DSM 7308]SHK78622.1 23S rRNA pseudouridine2605 synthase [[Clostridium] paradoxum JW-YL-7 = DSM 7308]
MRLNKYIALCGVASRRRADELILSGTVKVNGKVVNTMGIDIDENKDIVEVNGKVIKLENKKIYILLNKPEGYVTTVKDQFNRKSVLDLIDIPERVYPVGRLDYNTSGLLLLTNDGDIAFKLTHPKHKIYKTYIAKIKGHPTIEDINRFEKGIKIDNYVTAPAKFKILEKSVNFSVVEIVIYEGKNRQIRKMCEAIGHPVISLKRISIGNITLSNLKKGQWRYLNNDEIRYIKSL